MTDWAQVGWCDRCECTLDNGGAGEVCDVCGFDSRKAEDERVAGLPQSQKVAANLGEEPGAT